MTFDDLKHNMQQEREILDEIVIFTNQASRTYGSDREILEKTILSLVELLKILNKSIPPLVESISVFKKIGEDKKIKGLATVTYQKGGVVTSVVIPEVDKKKFAKELSVSSSSMKRLKQDDKPEKQMVFGEFRKPRMYAKLSNRFFFKYSTSLVDKGHFANVARDLRKANMPYIINTFVSMALFSTVLAAIASLFIFVLMLFFSVSLTFPILIPGVQVTAALVLRNFAIALAIPVVTFFIFILYPSTEKKSVAKRINNEVPFVAIHMAAIAGSGIEPTKIFSIIALSKDYPYTGMEIRKVINQVNIYGYDLINALKNAARNTSSEKLAELFNGLATTISSGGSMENFFEKRSESLLFEYRLSREKETKVAETFMDIYISVVIAAPMIMMLLLILMSSSGLVPGLTIELITFIIVSVVSLVNFVFLFILHFRQSDS